MHALVDVLWADFSGSTFTVFVKLWVAAADDPELYARLAAVERQIARAISTLIRDFVGEFAVSPDGSAGCSWRWPPCAGWR